MQVVIFIKNNNSDNFILKMWFPTATMSIDFLEVYAYVISFRNRRE